MKVQQSGFTLLEVLIAFVIMAMTLAVLTGGVEQAVNRVTLSSTKVKALLLAEAKMSGAMGEFGAVSLLTQEGDSGDGLHWKIEMTPVSRQTRDSARVEMVKVKVVVGWNSFTGKREVVLSSLRIRPVHAN
jgi:general secretion pathway protein I